MNQYFYFADLQLLKSKRSKKCRLEHYPNNLLIYLIVSLYEMINQGKPSDIKKIKCRPHESLRILSNEYYNNQRPNLEALRKYQQPRIVKSAIVARYDLWTMSFSIEPIYAPILF